MPARPTTLQLVLQTLRAAFPGSDPFGPRRPEANHTYQRRSRAAEGCVGRVTAQAAAAHTLGASGSQNTPTTNQGIASPGDQRAGTSDEGHHSRSGMLIREQSARHHNLNHNTIQLGLRCGLGAQPQAGRGWCATSAAHRHLPSPSRYGSPEHDMPLAAVVQSRNRRRLTTLILRMAYRCRRITARR